MAERTHVVVVGSGFGGAVTACRLAQAGARVTVLERGRRWGADALPFPRTRHDRWLWGRRHGLFDVGGCGGDVLTVRAAGVGGGSLLYSNVHLRMPADGFDGWPGDWGRATLDPYYALVETMLDVRPISASPPPWGEPDRTRRLGEAAEALGRGAQFFRPPLAVTFGRPGVGRPNAYGVTQEGCRHCGKCSIGCNHRAKNSLDTNYLALAATHGASIRARCEVTALGCAPGGGYRIRYDEYADGADDSTDADGAHDDGPTTTTRTMHADVLVLAAGAIGTTALLQQSASALGVESPRVGNRYSANGDAVRVAHGTDERWQPARGPAITAGLLCVEGDEPGAPWFLVEDGGFPPPLVRDLDDRVRPADPADGGSDGSSGSGGSEAFPPSPAPPTPDSGADEYLVAPDVEDPLEPPPVLATPPMFPPIPSPAPPLDGEAFLGVGGLLGKFVDDVAVLLAMGRDSADGRIRHGTHGPEIDWPDAGPLQAVEEKVLDAIATRQLGGSLLGPDGVRVSVHNLGGAVMADRPAEGVVDPTGLVFGTHAVYVVDGAALPSATGVNPSHTIAAVAERQAERMVHRFVDPQWRAPEREEGQGVPETLPDAPVGGSTPLPGDRPRPRERRVPPPPEVDPPRRSLLLAGGGLKIAFQAGVLQVLLHEAGLSFAHVDACSGGAFNLALLCEGRTGLEVADAWRDTRPLDGVSFNLLDQLRGRGVLTFEAYRRTVFPAWGLDWRRIRSSPMEATFTAWDVTHQRRHEFAPSEMSEDALVACLSQPLWFPPVRVDGTLYTDAVFDTDANVASAIDRDAHEIWVIWTVSRRPEWLPGPVAQFFHALEQAANGSLASELARVDWNNDEVLAGRHGLVGHCIKVRRIEAEVPAHYLVLLGGDRLHRLVELGVRAGRSWCEAHGYALQQRVDRDDYYDDDVTLRFTDRLRGRLAGQDLAFDLTLVVADTGAFVSTGVQRAELKGSVTSRRFGGKVELDDGHAHILVSDDDPTRKRMTYVLHLTTHDGPVTLVGRKHVESGELRRLWHETTTMYVTLHDGHVDADDAGPVLARGVVRMRARDVAVQVLTAEGSGGHVENLRAKGRFTAMFVGHLWDVYARRLLSYAPF